MPLKERAGTLSRAWTVLFISMLFLLPGIVLAIPMDEGAEVIIMNEEPPTREDWLDISVDNIEIVKPTQSNNLYPGQTIRIDVQLVHDDLPETSNVPISLGRNNQFTTVLVIDDTFDNVTTQYKQVTSMSTNYTGYDRPGPNALNPPLVVSFQWRIPVKPPEGATSWTSFQFQLFATITVDDNDKSDNFKSGAGLRVSNAEFSPYIWEEGQDDGEFESPRPHWVNVGDTVFIPFELRNEGTAVDIIGIDILSYPEGWNVVGFTPTPVYPNDHEDLDLPVQISNNPFHAMSGTEYRIVVRAYSNFYPEGPYEIPSTHTFLFKVNFNPGVEVYPENPQEYLEPGVTSDVNFILRNT
ncbi:MAG: hypothetical protein U9R75_09950, partial [Candidatus Thermoplasmatota archaeon]|nr:hypothetical protein [Candidatus Thermoplasmatota archaeon]